MKLLRRMSIGQELIMLITVLLAFVLPPLIATRGMGFRLDTDYDAMLPVISFFVNSIKVNHAIPTLNPYVGAGIPILGDPALPVFNPLLLVGLFLFGMNAGLRLYIGLYVLISGFFMWLLLFHLKLSRGIRFWGSTLYAISGAMVAQIVSGHFTVPYFLIPIFILCIIGDQLHWKQVLAAGSLLALSIYSGDFYQAFFWSLMLIILRGYRFVTNPEDRRRILLEVFRVFTIFFLVSSPRLIPFVVNVFPSMKRFFPVKPYLGSMHIFLFPLPFIIPFQVEFYDRPFFQRLFHFHYNWYEYYAFISPFPLLFLLKIKYVLRNFLTKKLLILLLFGALYVSLAFPYSPFFWVFHAFPLVNNFRAPQRIYVPMTAVLITLLACCGNRWWILANKRVKMFLTVIFMASIAWTWVVTAPTLTHAFESPRVREKALVENLRRADPSRFYVAVFTCCMQTFLYDQQIPIINYYYAWRSAETPNFLNKNGEGIDYDTLKTVRPTYVIAAVDLDLTRYEYRSFLEDSKNRVWKTDSPNIFPKNL